MSRRVLGTMVLAVLIGLLFATVTTSGGVGLWNAPSWEPRSTEADPIEVDAADEPLIDEPEEEPADRSSVRLPGWLTAALNVVLAGAAIVALVALGIAGWQHRPRIRWRRRPADADDFEVLPDVAAALADEADTHRAELLDGAPRNAIVACWSRLEQDVAGAGLPRHPADTSAEFTERVLAEYSVDTSAIEDLAALYREARFSDHPLGESARREALDALERLHRGLIDGAAATAASEAPSGGGR